MDATDDSPVLKGMVGDSPEIRAVYRLTRRVAASSATVLLTGETGTGKELIARAVHELSPRATGPFIRVNCGALSESLLESELFGHTKGAFTNAHENRTGRFEAAHGGTVFLDEINSVSYKLQVKLLRVLQEHEFERVGDTRTIKVDCRVVAATNRDLLDEVEAERFREDLYYRLNVVPINLPALRERPLDIPLLATFFAQRFAESGRPIPKIAADVLRAMQSYSWPGNVRELENYIERATILTDSAELTLDLFPPHVQGIAPARVGRQRTTDLASSCSELVMLAIADDPNESTLYQRVVSTVERELIRQVLKSSQGVQTKTATRLGINRNTLHKKVEEYGLSDLVRSNS